MTFRYAQFIFQVKTTARRTGFCGALTYSHLNTSHSLVIARFLCCCRRQQAGDALVEVEEEGDAVGVGGVGFFAAAGSVSGVYGGV